MLAREMLRCSAWTSFETWSQFSCSCGGSRQELGAWLAMGMGGITRESWPVSPPPIASLPALCYGLAPWRGTAWRMAFCECKRHCWGPKLFSAAWNEVAHPLLWWENGFMAVFWELLETLVLFAGEPECRTVARGMCSRLQVGGCSRDWAEPVVLWSRKVLAFGVKICLPVGGSHLHFLSRAQFLPLSSLGQQTDPMCGISHQACAELCFPFSFPACWANSGTGECVLALRVWGMYLGFHSLIDCRGLHLWLCLLICVHFPVYYCNPNDDHIKTWLLKLFLKRV